MWRWSRVAQALARRWRQLRDEDDQSSDTSRPTLSLQQFPFFTADFLRQVDELFDGHMPEDMAQELRQAHDAFGILLLCHLTSNFFTRRTGEP